MYRKISLFLGIFILLTVLTGCYDAVEIDDEVYPVILGVDQGYNNKFKITIQYPVYGAGNRNQSGTQQTQANIAVIEAPSIIEAMEMFGQEISRQVTLKHLKAIVFSEEIAVQGIGNQILGIQRYREIRSTMAITVVRGQSEDFIKENVSIIGESLPKMVELFFSQSQHNSYSIREQLFDFYQGILSNYEQPTAAYGGVNNYQSIEGKNNNKNTPPITGKGYLPGDVPREGSAKRELSGTAVFREDKMVGALDSYETRYFLLVKGKFKGATITINDKYSPDTVIVSYIKLSTKPKIKAYFRNGKPIIDVDLKLEADIDSIQNKIKYEELCMVKDLDEQIRAFLLKGINATVEKTQREYKSDIFGFGYYVAGNFKTIQEWENYNWLSHYDQAKINVNLTVNIRRMGIKFYTSDIWNSSGKGKK
ncbi:Ger(x)C family spore germination protein [Clostridium sp. JNZ X4-2]